MNEFYQHYKNYTHQLNTCLEKQNTELLDQFTELLKEAWIKGRRVFLCGNGGSAANAMHIANDLVYGVTQGKGAGIRATALTADTSILTCLANDLSYEAIFSQLLQVHGASGDILIALSGSGNSANILQALQTAKDLGITSIAILGYSGGKALKLANLSIHFPVNDMQIAEDLQLIVCHMVMQALRAEGTKTDGE